MARAALPDAQVELLQALERLNNDSGLHDVTFITGRDNGAVRAGATRGEGGKRSSCSALSRFWPHMRTHSLIAPGLCCRCCSVWCSWCMIRMVPSCMQCSRWRQLASGSPSHPAAHLHRRFSARPTAPHARLTQHPARPHPQHLRWAGHTQGKSPATGPTWPPAASTSGCCSQAPGGKVRLACLIRPAAAVALAAVALAPVTYALPMHFAVCALTGYTSTNHRKKKHATPTNARHLANPTAPTKRRLERRAAAARLLRRAAPGARLPVHRAAAREGCGVAGADGGVQVGGLGLGLGLGGLG